MTVRTAEPGDLPRPAGEEGLILLNEIWTLFLERLEWPVFDDIDRELYDRGVEWESAVEQLCPALVRGLDSNIRRTPQATQRLSLTVAGAASCAGSGPVLKAFLLMLPTAVKVERNWRPETPGTMPQLTDKDLEQEPGTDPQGFKQTALVASLLGREEPCFHGGGHDADKVTWNLGLSRDIRKFASITGLEDYWETRARYLGPQRTEADLRPFSTRQPEVVVLPAPIPAPPRPTSTPPEVAVLELTCTLHPQIAAVAADRFRHGHYQDAVMHAYKAIESRMQILLGSRDIGDRLMSAAVGQVPPAITVTRSTGHSLYSEQIGMRDLFKGAMQALRNPRAHGPDEPDEPDEAQEMLVFASFLMRRLDIEDEKRQAATSGP